jgi:hypothetical protein
MEKKLLVAILIILIIFGGAILFLLLQPQYLNKKSETVTPTVKPTTITPTTQVTISPTISPTKTDTTQKDKEDITKALATKHGKSVDETIVTVSKNTGDHASGSIKFSGEEGGAAWFAAKDSNGNWVIVYDGQGVIPCDDIEPYNFPKDIIPECWDEATNQNVVR